MIEDTNKISALNIAEYFIDKSKKQTRVITNKKLQKLVYYAQAWSLVLRDKPLFEEKVEAWVHGPAVKSIYLKYKNFGFSNITKEIDTALINKLSTEEKSFLDNVWSVYGGFDADYLEMLTHSEQPWQIAREGLQSTENSENEISLQSMKEFYSEKLANSKVS